MARQKRRRQAEAITADDPLTSAERVCEELRQIQWKTNCSTLTLQCILDSLRGNLGKLVKNAGEEELPRKATTADKKMQKLVWMMYVSLRVLCVHDYVFNFCECFHYRQGRRRCYCMVVWGKVATKSGDPKMWTTYAICVLADDTTGRVSPVNLWCTSL